MVASGCHGTLCCSLPQDQILTKCMIILRQEVVEERGEEPCVSRRGMQCVSRRGEAVCVAEGGGSVCRGGGGSVCRGGERQCVSRRGEAVCVAEGGGSAQCHCPSAAGTALLQKLSDIWTQFYTSILPTLQAIFAPVQVRRGPPAARVQPLFTVSVSSAEASFRASSDPHQLQGYCAAEDRHIS